MSPYPKLPKEKLLWAASLTSRNLGRIELFYNVMVMNIMEIFKM